MTSASFKASCIQLASGSILNANLLEIERLVEEAAKAGSRLVVLPENFPFMGNTPGDLVQFKEPEGDGQIQAFLSRLARRLGIWLVGGTVPLKANDPNKVRSSCLLYDDQGNCAARYDKMHLFDVHLVQTGERYAESEAIEAGSKPCVVDTPFGRLGLAICYDLRFPELFRAMLDQGAELIAVPSSFTALTGRAHWDMLVRARAVENLCFVLAAAQGGFHVSGRETYGHSMIVDPWGNKLAEQATGNGAVTAEIDPAFQKATRRNFPSIDHRRLHCE